MTTRRRRGSRTPWLPLAVGSLVVLPALGLGGWHYWTGTVQYSLRRLQGAIKDRDQYLFEQHVDVERMTRQAVDDLLDVEVQELKNEPLGPWEQIGANLGIAFVQLIKPRLVDEVRYAVIRGVESGTLRQGRIKTDSRPSQDQMGQALAELGNDFPKLKPLGRVSVHRQGSTATVELSIELDEQLSGESSSEQPLKVRFVRTPDRYWRATELENFKEVLRSWNKHQKERLELANQPIRKQIHDAVTVTSVTKEQGLHTSGTGGDAWVIATLKNNTSSDIQGLVADVTVRDAGGELKKARIQDLELIPPGETGRKVWPLNLDLSDNVDRLIYDTDPSKLVIAVDVRQLAFSDGRSMKIAESLDEVRGKQKGRGPSASPESLVQAL